MDVTIKTGLYRNNPVTNMKFELIKDVHEGKKGKYITVKNDGQMNIDIEQIRIKVENSSDYEIHGSDVEIVQEQVTEETDDEAMDRIAYRFRILDDMTKACISGNIRSFIVQGPPGVGKSYGIEKLLEKASVTERLADAKLKYTIVKGAISALGLYVSLFNASEPGHILVFDDCDVWKDTDAVNILKGALDTGKSRRISWNKDSRLLKEEGIPNSFEFKGSVIFVTNANMNDIRSKMIKPHLEALQSRSHYIDLTINNPRDKILRIKQVTRDNNLFENYNFSPMDQTEIIEYMDEKKNKLREMSLRMAIKIADLKKVFPSTWKEIAKATCML